MALFGSKREDGAFGLVSGSFPDPATDIDPSKDSGEAVLAGGCFWCVEAVYLELDGVHSVISGYAGGTAETADYRSVCSGQTGHAEVIKVSYDPEKVSFGMLLKIFFSVAHDPTQLNRQGNDIGPQYRSSIFYADAEQKRVAETYIAQIEEAKVLDDPIVTLLEKLGTFYDGEDYHQNYAARNPMQPYIAHLAAPKVQKLYKLYPEKTKR
jgi:peptide-methionine (S)-S-oxide reductase